MIYNIYQKYNKYQQIPIFNKTESKLTGNVPASKPYSIDFPEDFKKNVPGS